MAELGRQHLEANVVERAVDGPHQGGDVAAAAMSREGGRRGAGGHRTQHALAAQYPPIIAAAAAVEAAIDEDAIEPALEHRGLRMPPQRELQDHQICPFETRDFALHIGGQARGFDCMALFIKRGVKRRVVAPRGEKCSRAFHRVKALRVEVGHFYPVAKSLQGLDGNLSEGRIEGAGLGVAVDDQYLHGVSPGVIGRV